MIKIFESDFAERSRQAIAKPERKTTTTNFEKWLSNKLDLGGRGLGYIYLVKNENEGKYNYYLKYDRIYSNSEIKDRNKYFLSKFRELGITKTKAEGNKYYFYADVDAIENNLRGIQQQFDDEYSNQRSEYLTSLSNIDINQYKPTQAIINKLIAYRDKGSKVNVKAIKSIDKLLTYYYGAQVIGWDDLKWDIRDILYGSYVGNEPRNKKQYYLDILEAIDELVAEDKSYEDERTPDEITKNIPNSHGLLNFDKASRNKNGLSMWLPQKFFKFLIDNEIPVDFTGRKPGGEWDNNGLQWTEVETMVLYPNTPYAMDFWVAVHTLESGGQTKYTSPGSDDRTSLNNVLKDLMNHIGWIRKDMERDGYTY